MKPIPSVLLASVFWAIATQMFSYLGRKIQIKRLNFYKSVISLICFFTIALIQNDIIPPENTIWYLFASGILGFALGDLCIFYSFSQMGAARTLMISAFAPIILAIQSYFILDLTLNKYSLVGILFLVGCILFLSFDKIEGVKFNYKIASIALLGFSLDALGIIFSKKAFLISSELSSNLANLYRILIATIFLLGLNILKGVKFKLDDLNQKDVFLIILSTILGTFLSLLLWLNALSKAHPATVASLGALAPLLGATYEYTVKRKIPSIQFIIATGMMILGVATIVYVK